MESHSFQWHLAMSRQHPHCDLWQCFHLIWDNTHYRLPSSILKMVAYTLKITAQKIYSQSHSWSWVPFFQAVDGRAQRRQTAELTDSSSLPCTTTQMTLQLPAIQWETAYIVAFIYTADWQPVKAFWTKARAQLWRTQKNIHKPIFICTIISKL